MGFHEDTFTEASDTTLASHTPDVGSGYTLAWQDGSNPTLTVNSTNDDLRGVTANDSGVIYTLNEAPPSANYNLRVTIKASVAIAARTFYWGVRYQDIDNMIGVQWANVAGACQVYEKVAGTWSALGSGFNMPANNSIIDIEMDGTTLRVLDDTVELVSVTVNLTNAGKAWVGNGGGAELVTSTNDANSSWVWDSLVVTDLGGGGGPATALVDLIGAGLIPVPR